MLIYNYNLQDHIKKVNEVDIGGTPADEGGGGTPDFTGEPVSVTGNGGEESTPESTPENTGGEDNTGGDETEDFTDDGDGEEKTGNPEDGNTGGDETEDFTDDGDGDNMGGGEGDTEGGGDTSADTGSGSAPGDGSIQADDARGLENEIFSNLTPTQIAVKHKELKGNFSAMHSSISELIERVNEVNAAEYQTAITFVSQQLSDLKEMIADYITDVYSTKSYMENAMNYNRFLATLNGIKEILDEVDNQINKSSNSSE